MAASTGEIRPSRLLSSVSNCALAAVPMGAWVLSLSPAKAASGNVTTAAAAINDLVNFMDAPEHLPGRKMTDPFASTFRHRAQLDSAARASFATLHRHLAAVLP
jgi:hypothetical protein